MEIAFVRVNWGIRFTDIFFHIDKIKSYLQSYEKGRDVDDTTKLGESTAWESQNRMGEEITEFIRIADRLAQQELYEYLIGWVDYFKNSLAEAENIIKEKIDDYNENSLKEYNVMVERLEIEWKETKNFKTLKDFDFYELDNTFNMLFGGYHRTRLMQYRRYLEAPDMDLINADYIPQYLEIIRPIILRWLDIVNKRIGYLNIGNAPKALPILEPMPLPPIHNNPVQKELKAPTLKTNLTAGQILYLFQALEKIGAFESSITNIEICRFIASNISSQGNSNLSADSLAKKWKDIPINDIAFWEDRFISLHNKARTDNPNKLKYKPK